MNILDKNNFDKFVMPEPWTTNSENMNARDWNEYSPVGDGAIKDFLKPGLRRGKNILYARKGFGKSYLLVAKAQIMHKSISHATTIYPPTVHGSGTNWVEKLSMRADWRKLNQANSRWSQDDWRNVWSLVILTVALRLMREPESLLNSRSNSARDFWKSFLYADERQGSAASFPQLISSHLERIIQLDDDVRTKLYHNLRGDFLSPLNKALESNTLVMFFDNPDEFLQVADEHERNSLAYQQTNQRSESLDLHPRASRIYTRVWILAQLGLVEALGQLVHDVPKLYVYTSIRIEATANIDVQLIDSLLLISYSKQQLKEIFAQNVRMCRDYQLASPELKESDPISAFFGTAFFRHRRLKVNNEYQMEDIFQALLRHSLMSPRDLMLPDYVLSSEPHLSF